MLVTLRNITVFLTLFRPMFKKVLEKIGLDVRSPCHVAPDHKTSFNAGPECMEILTSGP